MPALLLFLAARCLYEKDSVHAIVFLIMFFIMVNHCNKVRFLADSLGFDLSVLQDVDQTTCSH